MARCTFNTKTTFLDCTASIDVGFSKTQIVTALVACVGVTHSSPQHEQVQTNEDQRIMWNSSAEFMLSSFSVTRLLHLTSSRLGAATPDCFHCRLICRLLPRFLNQKIFTFKGAVRGPDRTGQRSKPLSRSSL